MKIDYWYKALTVVGAALFVFNGTSFFDRYPEGKQPISGNRGRDGISFFVRNLSKYCKKFHNFCVWL